MNETPVVIKNKADHPVKIEFSKKKLYYITFETFTPGQTPWVPSNCNAITFRNIGQDTVYINQIVPLTTDDFISIPGDIDEMDQTQYTYRFENTPGMTQLLLVVRKTFID
jgi:hypothetical protein